jgi:hypothetical protein
MTQLEGMTKRKFPAAEKQHGVVRLVMPFYMGVRASQASRA